MPLQAFDNTGIINFCNNCNCTGVTAGASYAYNAGAGTVTVTDTSTITAPDAFKKMNVAVHDQFGKQVNGVITALAGNTGAIDITSLNRSKPLKITVTLVTNGGCTADGIATDIIAAGTMAGWQKGFSAAEAQA